MSARLAGAVVALVAAALLAASLLTSSLWAGHPSVNGRTITAKTVSVGVLGAEGCMTGGNNTCEPIPTGGLQPLLGLVELGTSGLLALSLIGLAITAFARREGRKAFAKLAIGVAIACGVIAVAMIVIGPKFVKANDPTQVQNVKVPLGFGMALLGGALVATVLAGTLAPREDAPRKPRPPRQSHPQLSHPIPAPEIDVLAMFANDLPPPPRPNTGPMAPLHTPLPAPPPFAQTGPFQASSTGPLPSQTGPQLRPLYDAQPAQGGTGGYVPTPVPAARPPTTLPTGSLLDLRAETSVEPEPPPPPPVAAPASGARAKAASIVPPPRTKAPSMSPPAMRVKQASVAPSFSLPGLPPPPPKPATGFDALPNTGAFAAPLGPYASTAAPLPPIVPPVPRHSPTTITPVVPPPSSKQMLPMRAATDPGDLMETREHSANERPTTSAGLGVGGDAAVGDSTDATFAPPTAVNKKQGDRADSDSDLAETRAVMKQEPEDLEESTQPIDPLAVSKVPVTTAPADLAPPKEEKATLGSPQPACPQCEAPMAWVEEHLRFYCKSCRMYF